ncbi:MAG: HEPN domain-containing protein [Planctomycetes bacterium]|nr:HEPN domain-containing protein [Planctomycetota bacterium]
MPAMPSHIQSVLDLADEKLKSARILLEAGQWRDAASRAYYCAFHAVTAVLLSKGLSFSSHGQTLGAFNREFVKTGLFPREYGARLGKMERDRQAGDYRATSPIADTVAKEDVAMAADVLAACRRYLEALSAASRGGADAKP